MMVWLPLAEKNITHASSVTEAGRNAGASSISMASLMPLSEKACPTFPGAKVAALIWSRCCRR